jgi:succinate-semialdehyde dehydrogenase/glutarate-semialdehyde dehydrogenase
VQDGVYDAFSKPRRDRRGDEVADEFEPGAVIGPLIDMKAIEKVAAHVADALKTSATSLKDWAGVRNCAAAPKRR